MDLKDYKIGTLGSHSSLQILKGARDEGFRNIIICEKGRSQPYRSYRIADEIIEIDSFKDIVKLEQRLIDENVILVPHGSFFSAYTDLSALNASNALYFGNKKILPWEENREKQRDWLKKAGLKLPKIYKTPEEIDGPVIIKFFGAGGGKGFFLAKNPAEFYKKIKETENKRHIIQEYIVGAPIYVHYFYSPLSGELEVMSMDKRYETNVDSIGRISAKDQLDLNIESSYNIMGNIPVVIREKFLPDLFSMGERVIEVSQELEPGGLIGPFCLETIITPEMEIYVFEISARIVAGTNPYINGSPYADLRYDVPMSTGRRVALEIKEAIESNQLEKVLG
ncbi:formate--phosphoribosylaminoimidazolecarboxamide ligase [Candidatus Parcubacteria bacterium]|nr:formate--phosphoribosylaminoimidazolecarboxamide ligase [Candidatus Parcubacteria bacterium]